MIKYISIIDLSILQIFSAHMCVLGLGKKKRNITTKAKILKRYPEEQWTRRLISSISISSCEKVSQNVV